MSIIEKLGFTPGPWHLEERSIYNHLSRLIVDIPFLPNDDEMLRNMKLIAAAPEMFMSIVGMVDCAETNSMYKAAKILELMKEVAEKACYPKKWEEIKELLK